MGQCLFAYEGGDSVVAVHFRDEAEADFLRADGLAGTGHGATAKAFEIHLADHTKSPPVFFRFALR